ncbi:MAG: DUF6734 family protein [Gilvibacter sp.]
MTTPPKIIYSLNVQPLVEGRWSQGNRLEETIYMTALSVLYSHIWYPEIELFVDQTAFQFLHMLPCKVTVMDHDEHNDLWMKSKIHAMARQEAPFVHLDTDVFITKPIDFDFEHCILERKELAYQRHYKLQVDFFSKLHGLPPSWHTNLGYSFNCGVFGFADMNLKNQFIDNYYRLEHVYKANQKAFEPIKRIGYEPCIVIEQYNLACLLADKNISPTLLLSSDSQREQALKAKEIGYNHLFGITKYKPNIRHEIDQQLAHVFPYWYEQVKKAIESHRATGSRKMRRVV